VHGVRVFRCIRRVMISPRPIPASHAPLCVQLTGCMSLSHPLKLVFRRFWLLLVITALAGYSNAIAAIQYSSNDGTSFEKAIVITGAPNDSAGIQAEYQYIRSHFPGATIGYQRLVTQGTRVFDLLEFLTADHQKRMIFFDITDFFGKY
jgi:hypothetical protein